jgi:hypothetical protein
MEWRPIETAPTNLPVFIAGETRIAVAEMSVTLEGVVEWWTTDDRLAPYPNGSELNKWEPTHWMPLPTLPHDTLADSDGDDGA